MIPQSLRAWFLIHFIVDLLAAVPLMIAPQYFLSAAGFAVTDTVAARLVAAAFFAIGTTSLLMRSAGTETYRALLNLKIIWSTGALIGLLIALAQGAPPAAWTAVGIFFVFWVAWVYFRKKITM